MFIDVSTQTSELQAQIMIQGMLYVPSEALDNIPVCRGSAETPAAALKPKPTQFRWQHDPYQQYIHKDSQRRSINPKDGYAQRNRNVLFQLVVSGCADF